MAGKKEKALEEELELYKRKSMLRGRWDNADKRHKKQVIISLLIILILFAVFLYSLMKSISEPVYLDRDMYMESLSDLKAGAAGHLRIMIERLLRSF